MAHAFKPASENHIQLPTVWGDATRRLRRHQAEQPASRPRTVTACSRSSRRAHYVNGLQCFKMWMRAEQTQCMKVISFHCKQTEASVRGNRATVWPPPVGPDDLSQVESACRAQSEAEGVKGKKIVGERIYLGADRHYGNVAGIRERR